MKFFQKLALTLSIMLMLYLATWWTSLPVHAARIPSESSSRPQHITQEVGGHIITNTTWDISDSPYVFTSSVTIDAGVVLTISPGVVVQGCPNCELQVQGALRALGTATQAITFTSTADTAPGGWSGIVFNGGYGLLQHSVVRYGGDANSVGLHSNVSLKNAGPVHFESCAISETGVSGADYGIYTLDSHVVISDTHFYHNGTTSGSSKDFALYTTGAATVLTVTDNFFEHNYGYAIGITPTLLGGLLSNTFTGDESQYTRRILVLGGETRNGGQFIAQPGAWGYELNGDLIVPPEVTLTASDGAQIHAKDNVELLVRGQLDAIGSHTPVTFTSSNDSAPQQWSGIVFAGGHGTLDNVTVRYAGDANSLGIHSNIAISNPITQRVKLINSRVLSESYSAIVGSGSDYGVILNAGSMLISGTVFAGNGTLNSKDDCALFIANDQSRITITHNLFRQNNGYAIGLPPAQINPVTDNTFAGDVGTYTRRVLVAGGSVPTSVSFTYQSGLASYELQDDLIVPLTATMIVSPQVNVMGRTDVELLVHGRLQARGSTAPITFTSATNNAPTQWAGLVFDQGTGDLFNVAVRYGGKLNSLGIHSNIAVSGTLTPTFSLVAGRVYSGSYNAATGAKDDYGLWVQNSHVTVSGTIFTQNGSTKHDYALRAVGPATLITATHNVFAKNGGYDVYLDPALINDFHSNTFTGLPGYRRIVLGSGDTPPKGTLLPQTGLEGYELDGTMHVPSGVTLTIHPDVAVMGRTSQGLVISGTLIAIGRASHPITFTSATNSGIEQWAGILFANGSGTLRYATVRYAGNKNASGVYGGLAAFNVLSSPLKISDSLITSNANDNGLGGTADYGLYLSNSHALLTRTLIITNGDNKKDYGVYLTNGSVLTETGNAIDDNKGNGLGIADGRTSSRNTQINNNKCNGVILSSAGEWFANEVDLANNEDNGVEINGGRLSMTCVQIHHNTDHGIHVSSTPANLEITYNGLYNNGQYDFNNESSHQLDISQNWWGANTDPVIAGQINGSVTYKPWLPANVCATEIGVSQKDSPDPLLAGQVLTYTITVTNAGPSRAATVVLSDSLDPLAEFITATTIPTEAGCSLLTNTVRCELGTVTVGTTGTVRLTVRPRADGILTNTVSVTTADKDLDFNNNTSNITTTSQPAVTLYLNVQAPNTALVYYPLSYTLIVSNSGPSTAHHVNLTHSLSSSMTLTILPSACQNVSEHVLCSWNELPPHTSASATLIMTPTETGMITSSTHVTSDEPDLGRYPDTITHTLIVTSAGDLHVSQEASTPAYVTSILTYTLTVSNSGPSTVEGVTLYDKLPPEITYRNASDFCVFSQRTLTCSLGSLPLGTQQHITITGLTGDAQLTLSNLVTVIANTADPYPADNTSALTTTLQPVADLSMSCNVPTTALAGELFTSTWHLRNNGPSPASNVQATISLPTGMYAPIIQPAEICTVTNRVVCHQDQITPTAPPLTITLGLSTTQNGPFTFPAMISATEFDNTPSNNNCKGQVSIIPQAQLSFTSKQSPDPASAGELYTMTMHLTNDGPSAAHAIVLHTEMPTPTTDISSYATMSNTSIMPWPRSFTYTFPSLPVHDSRSVTVTARVSPAARGVLTAWVTYSATEAPPQTVNLTTTLVARHNLHVVQQASITTLIAGESLTLTGIISNSGPADALKPTLTFTWGNVFTSTGLQWAGASCTPAPTRTECYGEALGVRVAHPFTIILNSNPSAYKAAIITTTLSDSEPATETDPTDNQSILTIKFLRTQFNIYLPLVLRTMP